jgi:hypothetical protein
MKSAGRAVAAAILASLWRLAAAVFLAGTISTGFQHWWSVLG